MSTGPTSSQRILVLSQVYPPDPGAGGQLIADACVELARQGHVVRVLTIDRGYDDPTDKYSRSESLNGVEIRRLPLSSFGKTSSATRLLSGLAFTAYAAIRGALGRKVDTVVVSSHPPMAPLAAMVIARLKRANLVYWIMDLNPDQAVALGTFAPASIPVRAMNWMQRTALNRARAVIVLDRFMAERVNAKIEHKRELRIIPPWPVASAAPDMARNMNSFRRRHGFGDRTVIMYSGNHGPSHPLATLIDVAATMRDDSRFVFAFVGGGVGKKDVDAIAGGSVVSLPYEPFETLHESLAAADVHVVTVGNAVVGINHPSKIYDAMAAGRPILLIGPDECHVADIFAGHHIGWHVRHGDVAGLRRVLEEIATLTPDALEAMGRRAATLVRAPMSGTHPKRQLCEAITASGP